jgi:hypothetical protein
MFDFLTVRNFILALSALIGVILFCVSCTRLLHTVNGSGAKSYTTGQIIMMFFVSMVMVSAVSYFDMGSVTTFQGNAYTVAQSDPWIMSENIINVLSQLNLAGGDINMVAKVVTTMMMLAKLLGLAIFVWITGKWYALSSGNSTMSVSKIVIYYFVAICLWNFGSVIQMVSKSMGYEIVI